MVCYASDDENVNDILDVDTVKTFGPPDRYHDVGQDFRLVFDILFFDSTLLLIL